MMKITFPWFGDNDPVTIGNLSYMRGGAGVSLAGSDLSGGTISVERVAAERERVESGGYVCRVLEDLPVHRDIKLRCGEFERHIDDYKENIARISEAGISGICTIPALAPGC